MKDLQEMNLVDDFLVNSLTSHKIYGEAGELFDVEPDQNDSRAEKESLPRRVRFYHAKIDAGNLAAGEDYGKLRNVVVIFITTYDPFDRDRMVYTIRNCCVEEPDLPYEDGAETLFLYTKGTKGDPPGELRELLRYMEDSTEENARSEGLKALHRMVTEVKRDGEVGFAYMKSFEREQRVREEGRREGLSEGRTEGLNEGKRTAAINLKAMNMPVEQIAKVLEEDVKVVEEWLSEA